MRTVNPEKHDAKRRQILDAAAREFARHGFDATTTAAICRAAGMSPGNLFHYFASKRDIFHAVIRDDVTDKAARLDHAMAEPDPLAGLLLVIDLLIEPAMHPLGPPLVMEAMLQARRDPALAAWLETDAALERSAMVKLVARAVKAKLIDPGLSHRAVASWLQTLIGAYYLQAATEPQFEPAEQARTLGLTVTRFLRAAPAPA